MANVVIINCLLQRLIKRNNNSSEDSDSSSDEEWELLKTKRKRVLRPRITNYAEEVVAQYVDIEFKRHFRMSRATFDYLLRFIHTDLIRKIKGCETIPARKQLMIALWKMATTDSYRSICDRFDVGRATALRAVRRVTNALFKLAPRIITWPSGNQAAITMRGFEEASGFPKIIGAIDGTHIAIDAPKENAIDYINRKGHHSVHLQVVCDHRALITHCYAGHPGSVHDQRIFRLSEVAEFLNQDERFPANSYIIGDAAYELHQRLLVPYRDNGRLTARQRNYNFRLSSARTVVERCFALLKGRMRSLLDRLPMQRVDLMAEYIIACCVIHNICMLNRDDFIILNVGQRRPPENAVLAAAEPRNREQVAGINSRTAVMELLPMDQY